MLQHWRISFHRNDYQHLSWVLHKTALYGETPVLGIRSTILLPWIPGQLFSRMEVFVRAQSMFQIELLINLQVIIFISYLKPKSWMQIIWICIRNTW